MFSSDKGILVSQGLPSKKSKGRNMKPVYRELLDNEKNLLNFQFADYHEHHEHFADYQKPRSKALSHYDKKLLKMSYLHGNFKFLVSPDYEENITYVDPDQEIKWKTVVKVKYSTSSAVNCPICLNDVYDMMFPKITRCGHIFCFSCILRYLSYKKTKCPLCEDFLMEEDLRGVQVDTYQFAKPGELIFLKLKKRRRLENTVYNAEDLTEAEDFIRIKRLSWEEILKLNEEELRLMLDYMVNLEHEHDKDHKPYVEQGINQVTMKIEKVQKAIMHNRQKRSKGSDEVEYNEVDQTSEEDFLYFYQDISGLNLFLHPINNKYIKDQYQEAEKFPSFLEASLIEIRGFEQTELTQKRYKFINHLPLNSNVNFAEVELKEHLSAENLEKLKTEMEAYKSTCKMTSVNQKKKDPSPKLSADITPHPKATNSSHIVVKDPKATPESKYKVEFPPSPSNLKLDDHQDYPGLPSLAGDDKESEAKGAWQKSIPSRKKTKAAKRNMAYLAEGLVERTDNNVNEKHEVKKEDDSSHWKIVQPIKNFFNSLKE